jgi:hypothetical protein
MDSEAPEEDKPEIVLTRTSRDFDDEATKLGAGACPGVVLSGGASAAVFFGHVRHSFINCLSRYVQIFFSVSV